MILIYHARSQTASIVEDRAACLVVVRREEDPVRCLSVFRFYGVDECKKLRPTLSLHPEPDVARVIPDEGCDRGRELLQVARLCTVRRVELGEKPLRVARDVFVVGCLHGSSVPNREINCTVEND